MDSGKRRRVMIGCVTFETIKVYEPVFHYNTDIVHLIHYVKNPESPEGKVYSSFYEETKQKIETNDRTIIEHNSDVNDFPTMMKILTGIMTEEYSNYPNTDIFVNISAGSSEYVAAATIVSMMFEKAICFAIRTKEYTVKIDQIPSIYYENDKPIGLTKSVYTPSIVPKITIPLPDEKLVKGLWIYINSNMRAGTVIQKMKEEGIWIRDSNDSTNVEKYDSVYYHRDFISKWIEEGWVTKDKYRNRYNITDKGRRILDIFYISKKNCMASKSEITN